MTSHDGRCSTTKRSTGRKSVPIRSTDCTRKAAERPKILAIAISSYISGQPSRIKYLEAVYDYIAKFTGVLHWNGEQILDWYQQEAKKWKAKQRSPLW